MSEEKDDSSPEEKKKVYSKWADEIEKAQKWFDKFQKAGEKVNRAYLDERSVQEDEFGEMATRLNLFYSNIVTLMSMLYGRIPKVEVDRRYADSEDDVARVASEILTRILNTDIECAGEDIASVFRNGLQDRLIVGLGVARLQYQIYEKKTTTPAQLHPETGEELAPAVEESSIEAEWIDTVYTHWRDILWSPARTYPEVTWKAYRSYMTKEKFKKRFPDIDASKVSFAAKGPMDRKDDDDANRLSKTEQVEVWEIWDKDHKCVYWWTKSFEEMLDHAEDPLELEGFFPDPPPLISNTTTARYIPKADYALAKDLYREIDELETRITMLTRACKVVGVYDKANEGIKRIFTEGVENDLIAVDNWAAFAEKGGIEGAINWVPIEEIANVISTLTDKQSAKIAQLYQVTGMNDIMRGAAAQETSAVSATQRKLEANYGSIRIEALQNEFARWVGDLQGIKAEIIAKHYQAQSIIDQSNIMATPDAQYAQEAVALIKDPDRARWRITVRPETLAIADYAQLKQDRVEYINGMATFLQSAAPILELEPGAKDMLIKMMKWGLAGFRGSNEIEGVMDAELAKMKNNPPQPKPDPAAQKAQAEMQKMQMEMQMEQQKLQAEMKIEQQKAMAEIQMEREKHQADIAIQQAKMQGEQQKQQMEMQQAQMTFQLKMKEMQMEFQMKMMELQAELRAERQSTGLKLQAQAHEHQINKQEREHEAAVEMESGNEELRRDKERAALEPGGDADA